jgi:hypothetical protein
MYTPVSETLSVSAMCLRPCPSFMLTLPKNVMASLLDLSYPIVKDIGLMAVHIFSYNYGARYLLEIV